MQLFKKFTSVSSLLSPDSSSIKHSSVLDYQHDTLDPSIWIEDRLKPEIKMFIMRAFNGFFQTSGFPEISNYVRDYAIGSSLATYYYKQDSDLDVKCILDVDMILKHDSHFKDFTKSELLAYLVDLGRSSYWLQLYIPGTFHQLDPYFYDISEFRDLNLFRYDSLYLLSTDTWIKSPEKLPENISSTYILETAKEKASYYLKQIALDIEKAKQDTIDFVLLRDFIKDLDTDDLLDIYKEFSHQLDIINSDLETLVEDKEMIKELRKREFSKDQLETSLEKLMNSVNYSDGNLIFKVIQRYGYMKILSEISKFLEKGKVESQDADKVLKILQS